MVRSATARELLLVVAMAAVGLLLATAAAFTPWPVTPGGSAPSSLVDLHGPPTSPEPVGSTAG